MSRVANKPVPLPAGVQAQVGADKITVKGAKLSLEMALPRGLTVVTEGQALRVQAETGVSHVVAGTLRANLSNLVTGVTKGYQKKLELVGVGYRAQAQGKALNLTLGFSHPINFAIPAGISIETPSQSEIIIKGADKQLVGQVAAKIRDFRKPEPYKGKGVKYAGERIIIKEAKKKG
ncbi:MAG: 50S ribosomal protein L6 [Nevskiales bacterium]